MSLNFGGGMFRDSGRIINSFDFADLLRGNTYIEFFGGEIKY